MKKGRGRPRPLVIHRRPDQAAAAAPAGARPCMIMRLISISGSMSSSRLITRVVCLPTQIDSEMIEARSGGGSPLSGCEQSDASVDHSRRFQSSASTRPPRSVGSSYAASRTARVT